MSELLSRQQVARPTLSEQIEPSATLGGNVLIRGLLLSARLQFDAGTRAARVPLDGETEQEAAERAGSQVMRRMLHVCVLDADSEPLMSEEDWDVFGGSSPSESFRFFNIAMRLSGQDLGHIEKN